MEGEWCSAGVVSMTLTPYYALLVLGWGAYALKRLGAVIQRRIGTNPLLAALATNSDLTASGTEIRQRENPGATKKGWVGF